MPYIFQIGGPPEKVIPCIPPDYHTFHKVWLKLDGNYGRVAFWKFSHRKFSKVHRMTPNWTQGIGHEKYPIYAVPSTARHKFSSIWLHDMSFSRYCTFEDFPIESHVNIWKCRKYSAISQLVRLPRKLMACIVRAMVANVLNIRFAWDHMSSILKLPAPYMALVRTISNCHNF